MTFALGDAVRVTHGDMQGRIGVIRRTLGTTATDGCTYGVEFSGETPLSNFRDSNIESAGHAHLLPEFLTLGSTVRRLTGNEPYQLLAGGWMGKRRRYWLRWDAEAPQFAASYEVAEAYDFRRFPLTRDEVVVAGLWSRYQPVEEVVQQVMHLIDIVRGDDIEIASTNRTLG